MRIQKLIATVWLGLLFLSASALPAAAQTDSPNYAILIVGDDGSAEMLREEQVLIQKMGELVRQQQADQRLPIYSYHFSKERERAYCENKLNVLSEDLLFVGVVKLKDKVPLKVVYRIDRITNPSRAAKDILESSEDILAEERGTGNTVVIPPTENTENTETVQPNPGENTENQGDKQSGNGEQASAGDGFRVQLGSFAQLKYAQDKVAAIKRSQLQASIVETSGPDGDTLYKVVTPPVNGRTAADELLKKFHDAGFEEAFLARNKN